MPAGAWRRYKFEVGICFWSLGILFFEFFNHEKDGTFTAFELKKITAYLGLNEELKLEKKYSDAGKILQFFKF